MDIILMGLPVSVRLVPDIRIAADISNHFSDLNSKVKGNGSSFLLSGRFSCFSELSV